MPDEFKYDVFLSHSAKDKPVVCSIAERLRKDGLEVWLDEWVLKPGDNIPAKIEEGLERSRVLVLCMSANAFDSGWAQLESHTFRFRDPLNKERRFIPLRLDDAPIKGSLAQFLYINWRPAVREQEYAKLLEACRKDDISFGTESQRGIGWCVPGPQEIVIDRKVRDDFSRKVKETLVKRVGMRCSNPWCRKLTSGPQTDPNEAMNIGVAAHITAASKGGPRYDPSLSKVERSSIENGIWLCQNCAKLVDNDEKRYTAKDIRWWKTRAEEDARLGIETNVSSPLSCSLAENFPSEWPQINNFILEYTGTPQNPAPFGGRHSDLRTLNDWLDNPDSPSCLLLAASAGRGKSALLVHWVQQIKSRTDIALVFFPVSIRFRTNLSGTLFASLVAQLAQIHGEKPPHENTPIDLLRRMVTDYLCRSLSDGRRLLVVLDGIDEGADLDIAPDFSPQSPDGPRVVVSARYLADDPGPEAWLGRLGWLRPGNAKVLDLTPLNQEEVADVLSRMGGPLDALGRRVDIVTELHRLSEGDPLLVGLYVADLWSKRDTAAHLHLEDLRRLEPGLGHYFKRWLDDQQKLWGTRRPLGEKHVQALLNLLACALGPLSRDDIHHLMPQKIGLTGLSLDEALRDLGRFIIGNGREQGYVFSHSRFADFFREKMFKGELRQWTGCYLSYGARSIAALNRGDLSVGEISPYLVQYYAVHLEKDDADVAAFTQLASTHGWPQAWLRIEGTYSGYMRDLERVRESAVRANSHGLETGGKVLPFVDVEIRCALIRSSIGSLARGIKPELMSGLVQSKVWTISQGNAFALHISEPDDRAKALIAILKAVTSFDIRRAKEIGRTLLKTLGEGTSECVTCDGFQAVATYLPKTELIAEVQSGAERLNDRDKATVLTTVAKQIGNEVEKCRLLSAAFNGVYQMEVRGIYEGLEVKTKSLIDIASEFSDPETRKRYLRQAHSVAMKVSDQDKRGALLLSIAERFTDQRDKRNVLMDALRPSQDASVNLKPSLLAAIAAQLPTSDEQTSMFKRAVTAALKAVDDKSIDPLLSVAQHMDVAQKRDLLLSEASPFALSIKDDYWRANALAAIGQHLGDVDDQIEIFQYALEAALRLDGLNKAHMLWCVAKMCPGQQKSSAIRDVIQAARDLSPKYRDETVHFLIDVATLLTDDIKQKQIIHEALQIAAAIPDEIERDCTCEIGAECTAKMGRYPEALDFAETIRKNENRDTAYSAIVSVITAKAEPPDILRLGLQAARGITEDWRRSSALVEIAGCFPVGSEQQDIYREALTIAERIRDWSGQASTLCAITPYIADRELQRTILHRAKDVATRVNDKTVRIKGLTEVADCMAQAGIYEDALALAGDFTGSDRATCLAKVAKSDHDAERQGQLYAQALEEARRLPSYNAAPTLATIAKEMVDRTEQEKTLLESLQVARHVYYNDHITDAVRAGCLMDVIRAATETGHVSVAVQASLAISEWKWESSDEWYGKGWKEMAVSETGRAIGRLGDANAALEAARELRDPVPFVEIALRVTDKTTRRDILDEARTYAEAIASFNADPGVMALAAADIEDNCNSRHSAYVDALKIASDLPGSSGRSERAIDTIMEAVVRRATCQEARLLTENIRDRNQRARWLACIANQLGSDKDKTELLLQALDLATKPIDEMIKLMGPIHTKAWYPAWLQFLRRLSSKPRWSLLSDIAALTPMMKSIGSDKTLDKVAVAIMDVCDWWP